MNRFIVIVFIFCSHFMTAQSDSILLDLIKSEQDMRYNIPPYVYENIIKSSQQDTIPPIHVYEYDRFNEVKTIRIDPQIKAASLELERLEGEGVVYYENIGETYWEYLPYTGWSDVENGLTKHKPWDEIRPRDNHPYLAHSEGRYAPIRKQAVFNYYRIKNGKKYTGSFVDYIENQKGEKEIYFKGEIKNGLLTGRATFYFTSKDKYNRSGFTVGDIKSTGRFEEGEMVGHWQYFGVFGFAGKWQYRLKEERFYEKGKIFPLHGKYFQFYNNTHYKASEYAYEKDWVMKYVKQFTLEGNMMRIEELIDYEKIGSQEKDYKTTYQITAYHPDPKYKDVLQAKGKKTLQPGAFEHVDYWKYYFKNGNISAEGNYQKGEQHGIWKYYYENGNQKWEEEFTYGKAILLERWDEEGNHTVKDGKGKIKKGTSVQIIEGGKMVRMEKVNEE